MRRKVPSTTALLAFEAAARKQSFTRAAEELALTQSAVCRQIAALEDFLGCELFRRTQRGVRLTEAGLAYSRKVTAQLDGLERDCLAMRRPQGAVSLELAVVPTFATQWLLPRLSDFQVRYPQISLNLTTRTRPFLFADTEFDAAIYSGDGDWPGTEAHFLLHEPLLPVASPALLVGLSLPLNAEQLAKLPLLQQSTRPQAWRQWFAAQGVNLEEDLPAPRLELFSMLAQAACYGLGAALIPPLLIQQELADGRLQIVMDVPLTDENRAYYLIIPERKRQIAALCALRDWLIGQARAAMCAATARVAL